MEKILIIGASGHAKVTIEALELNKSYEVYGLIDSYKSVGETVLGHKILGKEEMIPSLIAKGINKGFIAIGDNWVRYLMYKKVKELAPEFEFITVIHPSAVISPYAKIGKGTIVLASVAINTDSVVGDFCIINTNASFGHDSILENFSSLAPGVTVGGTVHIGEFTAISIGVSIIQNLRIGQQTVIGAGSVVTNNIGDNKTAYGVPARIIRKREKGESYLNNIARPEIKSISVGKGLLIKVFTTTSNIEIIEDQKEWQQLLSEFDKYDFYHTYDYHQISKSDNEIPLLIKYTDKEKMIGLPLLLRKIFDTDYYDITSVYGYAGPLLKNIDSSFDNNHYKKQLNSFFVENNVISVFSRLNPFIKNQETILKGLGEIKQLSQIVNIDLTSNIDIQRSIFSKTTKRYVNKARRVCSVKTGVSNDDISKFKELYYENMDRVNARKLYYFDDNYFHSFMNSKDFKTDVLLAIHNETNEIISAAMMVKTNDIIQYHISGTRNDYLYLTPIRLLIDEMRIRGTKENYKYFNLGGGLGSTEDSLFRFKSSFSKDFKNFKIWKYIVNEKIYNHLSKQYVKEDIKGDFFPRYRNI